MQPNSKIALGINATHKEALAAYLAAGHSFPAIPAGCNTVWYHFTTTEGHPAIIINQTGIPHLPEDNEEEVNGCTLVTALHYPDPETARQFLERFAESQLPPRP